MEPMVSRNVNSLWTSGPADNGSQLLSCWYVRLHSITISDSSIDSGPKPITHIRKEGSDENLYTFEEGNQSDSKYPNG